MFRVLGGAALFALAAAPVLAGGIERSRTPYSVLFEDGNYVQLSYSNVSPDVSGTYDALLGGGGTGNMSEGYDTFSFAYKHQFSDKFSFAIMVNEPYLAHASYGAGAYTGLRADLVSTALAAVAHYQATERVSIYGGLRQVEVEADIAVPAALVTADYTAVGAPDKDVGFILGAAYEIPDIALRVGLTYESEITTSLATTETFGGVPVPSGNTEIKMPQTLTLDFQSGIAEDTLLFGSIRWAEWSVFSVEPQFYVTSISGGLPIVAFDNDTFTYTLGLGRRLNENWSVFGSASYEKSNGGTASRLSPTDGSTTLGLGATYTRDNWKITAGAQYAWLGDAVDSTATQFSGNNAFGWGLQIGYSF